MKIRLAKYGKYRVSIERKRIDRRELMIVFTVSSILGLILVGKYIGFDIIEAWFAWISMR